jgi:hypothetical protein
MFTKFRCVHTQIWIHSHQIKTSPNINLYKSTCKFKHIYTCSIIKTRVDNQSKTVYGKSKIVSKATRVDPKIMEQIKVVAAHGLHTWAVEEGIGQ